MNLPSYFQQIKSMPDDPEGSSAFMTGADTFEAFAIQHPIPIEHAMPTNDDWTIINGIHNTVTESQALIALFLIIEELQSNSRHSSQKPALPE